MKSRALGGSITALSNTKSFDEAAKVLSFFDKGRTRTDTAGALGTAWAKNDSATALAWAEALQPGLDRSRACSAVFQVILATESIDRAMNVIEGLPDEIVVTGSIGLLGKKLATTNVESAIAWVQRLPVQYRGGVQTAIVEQLAIDDFSRASSYAIKSAQETGNDAAISAIARFVTAKTPQESVNWIQSIPPKWERGIAGDVMSAWLPTDPQIATQIALGLKPGGARDAAVAAVANHMYFNQKNYTAALDMVKQIGDVKLRGMVARSMPIVTE